VYNIITGAKQARRAKKLMGEYDQLMRERPEYAMPEEVMRAAEIARAEYADPSMPGETQALDRAAMVQANTELPAAAGAGRSVPGSGVADEPVRAVR